MQVSFKATAFAVLAVALSATAFVACKAKNETREPLPASATEPQLSAELERELMLIEIAHAAADGASPYPDVELEAAPSMAIAARAAAAPRAPLWTPNWQLPELQSATQTLPWINTGNAGTNGLRIVRTNVKYTGYWGAWVPVNQPHARTVIRDVELVCVNGSDNLTRSKWGFRPYLIDGIVERVIVRGAYWEHDWYSSVRGDLTFRNVWLEDAGAQGLQLRHSGNRGDPQWQNTRFIRLEDVTAVECGQPRGAGRAGFALSVKDMGPETTVVFQRVASRTVNQRAVRTSGSLVYNSFGAVCVEHCKRFEWTDGWVEHLDADRPDVQLFDYVRNQPQDTGPDQTYMRRVHVAMGGDIAVRIGDGSLIDIADCTGTGRIMVYRWNANTSKWQLDNSISTSIEAGFYWVKP